MADRGAGGGPPELAAAGSFRDRSRGLTGFGWLLIASGVGCGLLAVLLAAAARLAPAGSGAPPLRTAAFNVFFYGALGVCFIFLGIGSIRARRWARALALVAGWCWLLTGVLALAAMAFILPQALSAAGLPPGSVGCALGVAALVFLLFLVALPLAVVLFYRREDVRRTTEWRNPSADWSDRVPPTVLGVVAALAFGGVVCLLSVPFLKAIPIFGSVLSGVPAALVLVAFCALSFVLAWGSWRQSPAAWWGLVALQVFGFVNFLTLRSLDTAAYMREAGYPDEQVRQAASMNILGSPSVLWVAAAASLALLGFLVAIRPQFRGQNAARAPIPG